MNMVLKIVRGCTPWPMPLIPAETRRNAVQGKKLARSHLTNKPGVVLHTSGLGRRITVSEGSWGKRGKPIQKRQVMDQI
jgi:hypothetical protein